MIIRIKYLWWFFLCSVVFFFWVIFCYAYTDDQLADAIFKAENSKSHPYGIMIKYKQTSPRQSCLATIKHAKKDWNGQGDFIEFLANRYAPIGVKNDPKGLNKNWIKNVKAFLKLKGD